MQRLKFLLWIVHGEQIILALYQYIAPGSYPLRQLKTAPPS